jgi:hypothetical protein
LTQQIEERTLALYHSHGFLMQWIPVVEGDFVCRASPMHASLFEIDVFPSKLANGCRADVTPGN